MICDTRFGHGKEPMIFWSPLRGERVMLLMRVTSEALIQMGDWYSEELIPKLNEITAMVRKSITA
jgi:N-formylglutamate amidohydrolase